MVTPYVLLKIVRYIWDIIKLKGLYLRMVFCQGKIKSSMKTWKTSNLKKHINSIKNTKAFLTCVVDYYPSDGKMAVLGPVKFFVRLKHCNHDAQWHVDQCGRSTLHYKLNLRRVRRSTKIFGAQPNFTCQICAPC